MWSSPSSRNTPLPLQQFESVCVRSHVCVCARACVCVRLACVCVCARVRVYILPNTSLSRPNDECSPKVTSYTTTDESTCLTVTGHFLPLSLSFSLPPSLSPSFSPSPLPPSISTPPSPPLSLSLAS